MVKSFTFIIIFLFLLSQSDLFSQENGQTVSELESSLAKFQSEGNLLEMARCHTRLGFLYNQNRNYTKAIEHFKEALSANEALGNINAVKVLSSNLGMLLSELNKNEQALAYFNKSLKINESQGKRSDIVSDLINIAQVQQNLKNYPESNKTAEKASGIAQETSSMVSLKNCYTIMSENFEKLGQSEKAKEYFDLANSINRKLQKEEMKKYETRTQEAEAEVSQKDRLILTKEGEIREVNRIRKLISDSLNQEKVISELREKEYSAKERLQAIQQRNIRWIIGLLSIILSVVGISLLFIFKQLTEKKKANVMLENSNRQIIEQKKEIEKQRDIAHLQKRKITDSILYAKKIQHAALSPKSVIEDVFPDYFILYRPKDIVSGDFYWMVRKDGVLILAAVDCTGHGVPGAFMSMLGIASLNDIVNRTALYKPLASLKANEILNQLREHLIFSLHQSDNIEGPKDGMDIALCIIDIENRKLQFSGAHNPAFIIRKGQPILLDADKMTIGIYKEMGASFSNQEIELKPDDALYIYSDGYYDQIGGPKGHKLFSHNFRQYLLEIYNKPMEEQKILIENYYDTWKGKNEQTDDVMVIGLRFNHKPKNLNMPADLTWSEKHFLIAEDTELNYVLLREALKPTNVKITRVLNGVEAVNACVRKKFDLILMDINMPEMDGLEASRKIREFDQRIPIIAHTALVHETDVFDFKKAGCNDFIAKPIDLKRFLNTISNNLLKNS